jgi:hypothetical protein
MRKTMYKNLLANAFIIATMIGLVGTSESAFPEQVEKYAISLEKVGVAFDIPKGYGIFEMTDSLHYSIGTGIQFGKELSPGHLNHIPGLTMGFWPTGHDGNRILSEYRPCQYVDVEFERVKDQVQKQTPGMMHVPEYVKLFGNKAIRYDWGGLDGYTTIVGCRSASEHVTEHLIRILRTYPASPAVELLFNSVLNSLRVFK